MVACSMSTIPPSWKAYPTNVSDEERALVALYLTLVSEDALQRRSVLREVFNALHWIVGAGATVASDKSNPHAMAA